MFSSKNLDLVVGHGGPQKDSKKATSSAFVYPGQPTPLQQTLSNLRKPSFSTEEIRSVCSRKKKKKQKTKPKNSRLACPSDEAHSISLLPRRQTPLLGLFPSFWLFPRTKECSMLFFNGHSLTSSLANYRIISARQKGPHSFLQSRCMQGFDPETSTYLFSALGFPRSYKGLNTNTVA